MKASKTFVHFALCVGFLLAVVPRLRAEPWKVTASRSLPTAEGLTHQVQTLAHDGSEVTLNLVSFDAAEHTFVVYDQGVTGRASVREFLASKHCLAGTNGGFFKPDFDPVGLLVAEGKLIEKPSRAKLLSGALVVTGNHVALRRSNEPLPGKNTIQAIQSGPFLVEDGHPVPGLNAVRSAWRTAVFTDGARRWGLVCASPLTLEEFGAVLADPTLLPDGLKITRALNLDGGSSTNLWVEQPKQASFSLRESNVVRDFVAVVPRHDPPKK